MSTFISGLLVLYMSMNLLTDLKEKVTKNLFHAAMLTLAILFLWLGDGPFLDFLIVLLIAFILGVLRQLGGRDSISAGDTKMLVIISGYFYLLGLPINAFLLPVVIHLVYFSISTMVILLFVLIAKLLHKKKIRIGQYQVDIKKGGRFSFSGPEAFPLLLTVVVFLFFV